MNQLSSAASEPLASEGETPYEGLVEKYCEALRVERNLSMHTIRGTRADLLRFTEWVGDEGFDLYTLTHRTLRAYLGELDKHYSSRSSVNRHLSSIRGFYKWLVSMGLSTHDPASAMSGPKRPKTLPHVIRPADMVRLLQVYGPTDFEGKPREQSPSDMRNAAILEFMYACGARISETSEMQLMDVDFAQGQAKLFGKGSKERVVPLHDLALASMQKYLKDGRGVFLKGKASPYFFVSSRGNKMTTDAIRKMFNMARDLAGLEPTITPHTLRHTFASDVLAGGADLRTVQEMLGHASLSTTQIYTHTTPGRLKAVHMQAHPRG